MMHARETRQFFRGGDDSTVLRAAQKSYEMKNPVKFASDESKFNANSFGDATRAPTSDTRQEPRTKTRNRERTGDYSSSSSSGPALLYFFVLL